MAEYPTRACGKCPYLGKYEAIAKEQGDFLERNTVPAPQIELKSKTTLNEDLIGVSSTFHAPNLKVPPHVDLSTKLTESKAAVTGSRLTPSVQNVPSKLIDVTIRPVRHDRSREILNSVSCKEKNCCPCAKQLSARGATEDQLISPPCCCTPTKLTNSSVAEDCPPSPYNIDHPRHKNSSRAAIIDAQTPPSGGSEGRRITDQELQPTQSQQLKGILKNKNEGQSCPCENMAYTAGRLPPGEIDPSANVPVPNELRPVPTERAPCFLPQPEDKIPVDLDRHEMGPIGPWATGRVDWSPIAGLTGTRPVVDKYSIARFSEGEWRKHNKDMLDMATTEQHKANLVEWNGRQCLEQTRADIDKNQEDNTKRLTQRAHDLHRWKCELERAIAAAAEEISLMEEQRRRLKSAAAVLQMPESIAGECLERRTGRLDPELVRDIVEEELIKEFALTAELRETFYRTLKDVEMQLLEDKTAKQRLEYDWSDKKGAHEIEAINVALNNNSTVLLFKPGSTQFPDEQSSEEYWEHFTRETLQEAEATRQRSVALRGTLDAILINAARDLRSQADKVDLALSKRIACTEDVRIRLENDLKKILQRLADVETTMKDIRQAIRNMDTPMKKAHTRLDNRLQRHRVENCRDQAHFGLVEEVKLIADNVSALAAQLKQAEESQASLIKARSDLEREIMVKRKTLEIDRDRTQLIRSHYPSATALSGH